MTSRDLAERFRTELDSLLQQTAAACAEDAQAAGLLVALSGGPDSVALLSLAAGWAADRGQALVAAHFNHRLRGADADQDEVFCRELCEQFEVPLLTGGADPRPLARQRGRGLEEAARHLRLGFLAEVRAAHGLMAVATGHHRDDQAETVLMRVCRGTGLDGLRGLRPRRGRLIRPLLGVTRAEILAYLLAAGLAWREDPTNLDGSNTRSRVRRELLPLVQDIFGPGADLNPARLADLCEAEFAHLDALATAAWQELAMPTADLSAAADLAPADLAVAGLNAMPPAIARRVLRRWLQPVLPVDLELVHIEAILRWLRHGQSGSSLDLPGPLQLAWDFDRVRISTRPPPAQGPEQWRVRLEPLGELPATIPPPHQRGETWRLISAADPLVGNIQLRQLQPGDRLQPFGLAGHKKLSDLVQEKRIPRAWRPGLLVVVDQVGPLWVVGVAQAERTRVLPTTRQAVTIILERRHPDLDG